MSVNWKVLIAETVAVTTLTEVLPPTQGGRFSALNVSLQNSDATQTVDAWVQAAPTLSGPWDTLEAADFTGIAATASRTRAVSTNHINCLRVVATASGAGADVVAYVWGVGDAA